MLRKILTTLTMTIALGAMTFAAPAVVTKTPKSGATQSITSLTDMISFFQEFSNIDMEEDEFFKYVSTQAETPEYLTYMESFQLGNLVTKFSELLDGNNEEFNKTGHFNAKLTKEQYMHAAESYPKPAGSVYNIREPFECEYDLKANPNGFGNMKIFTNGSEYTEIDLEKAIGHNIDTGLIKGMAGDVIFRINANGTFRADDDDYSDGYDYFLEDIDWTSAKINTDLDVFIDAAITSKMPSGMGGKMYLHMKLAYNGLLDAINVMEMYKAIEEYFTDFNISHLTNFPVKAELALEFYDDNNQLTYRLINGKSISELMGQIMIMATSLDASGI